MKHTTATHPSLFDPPRPALQPLTVRCSGCPATATTLTRARGDLPYLPDGWHACGVDADGGLALWCHQCWFERF